MGVADMLKTRNKIFLIAAVLLAICVVILVAKKPAVLGDNSTESGTLHISGILAEKTFDALTTEACLIVKGTVADRSEAFQIRSPSGSLANHTDYTIDITNVFRGNAEQSGGITVRVQGGTVGEYTETYEHSPVLEEGKDYLLFLYKPGRGGAFNTNGDYYYILGLSQGIYAEQTDGTYVSQSGSIVTNAELEAAVSALSDTPVDTDFFRNEFLSNQARNLESGFITQEEYENMIANIDIYASAVE
jgi:hypothetical protein